MIKTLIVALVLAAPITTRQAQTSGTPTNVPLTPSNGSSDSFARVDHTHSLVSCASSGQFYQWNGSAWSCQSNAPTATTATTAGALSADPADCSGNNWARGINASGVAQCAQPAFSNISGTAAQTQGGTGTGALTCLAGTVLTSDGTVYSCTDVVVASDVDCHVPPCVEDIEIDSVSGAKVSSAVATATALAADPADCSGNNWSRGINASGTAQCVQPAFSNLSGAATDAQLPATIAGTRVFKTDAFANSTSYQIGNNAPISLQANLCHNGTGPTCNTMYIGSHTHADGTGNGGTLAASVIGSGTLPQTRGGTGAGALTCSAGNVLTSNGTAYSCTSSISSLAANGTNCANTIGFAKGVDASGNAECSDLPVRANYGLTAHTDGLGLYSGCATHDIIRYNGDSTWLCDQPEDALALSVSACNPDQAITCDGTSCYCAGLDISHPDPTEIGWPTFFDGAEDFVAENRYPTAWRTPSDLTITDPSNYCSTHTCTYTFAQNNASPITGTYAFKSMNDGIASSVSSMRMKVYVRRPTILTFNWKLQSEASFDFAEFYIDGTQQFKYAHATTYQNSQTFTSSTLAIGSHEFVWRYRKDGSADTGTDEFTVDNIKLMASGGTVSSWHNEVGPGDTGWTLVTFSNSWVDYESTEATWGRARYRRSADGLVTVSGTIKHNSGTSGTVAFTLPAGYRPYKQIMFAVDANTTHARIYVAANGDVTPNVTGTNSSGWVSLDGIQFYAN